MTPAIWSAIAATFSALSAWVVLLIQRRNLIESVRPIIMLDGWERRHRTFGNFACEEVSFKSIRNVGRGPALHLYMNASSQRENKPVATMSTLRAAIVPNNDRIEVDNPITLFFANAEQKSVTNIALDIQIWCLDVRGRAHITLYKIMIFEDPNMGLSSGLAPGVAMLTWKTHSETVWRRKVRRQIKRVPLIRRLAREDF